MMCALSSLIPAGDVPPRSTVPTSDSVVSCCSMTCCATLSSRRRSSLFVARSSSEMRRSSGRALPPSSWRGVSAGVSGLSAIDLPALELELPVGELDELEVVEGRIGRGKDHRGGRAVDTRQLQGALPLRADVDSIGAI